MSERTSPKGSKRRPLPIVRSVLGGIAFAVEALKVDRIEDADSPEVGDVQRDLDLATLLGLPAPGDEAMRRAVVVKVDDGLVRLRVGELARIITLAPGATRAIPPFLEGLASQAGIGSIFVTDDGLGYVIDVDGLDENEKRQP